MCEQLMPIIICSSHWKTYTTCSCWCFDWLREHGKLRGAISLEPSLPPLKITIDLEDEDMQWTVIYIAFASNERAFAQSRQSFSTPIKNISTFFVVCLLLLFWGRGYSYFGEEGDWISILLKISKTNANFDIIAACFSSPSLLLLPFASCS